MTLRELIAQHPEMADLDIVVYSPDGEYHYVGASGSVYVDEQDEGDEASNVPVLVFSAN